MMKIYCRYIALAAAVLMAATSCRKASDCGYMALDVYQELEMADMVKSHVSDFATVPPVTAFDIVLKDKSDQLFWKGKLTEWDKTMPVQAGEYIVVASYGTEGEEGPEKPYYLGEKNVRIVAESTADVLIPVKLGNVVIKPLFTDAFKNYFTTYSVTMKTGSGSTFTFSSTAADPVFVDAFKFTLSGTFKSQSGADVNFPSKSYEDLVPGVCYTLKFDASTVGGVKIVVEFNDTVTDVEVGEIELN